MTSSKRPQGLSKRCLFLSFFWLSACGSGTPPPAGALSAASQARERSLPRHAELFSDGIATTALATGDVVSVSAQSLKAYDTPVKSQGARSTCSAFATVAALENLLRQSGQSYALSEEHLWSYYQRAWEPDALTEAKTHYLTTEINWPYDPHLGRTGTPAVTNPESAGVARLTATTPLTGFPEVGAALARRHPVIMVADVTKALLNVGASGVVAPGAALTGGAHVMELVAIAPDLKTAGTSGGGYVTLKNSWGSTSGDRGYVYIPFSYCTTRVAALFGKSPAR